MSRARDKLNMRVNRVIKSNFIRSATGLEGRNRRRSPLLCDLGECQTIMLGRINRSALPRDGTILCIRVDNPAIHRPTDRITCLKAVHVRTNVVLRGYVTNIVVADAIIWRSGIAQVTVREISTARKGRNVFPQHGEGAHPAATC